jgi:hypothetical protein
MFNGDFMPTYEDRKNLTKKTLDLERARQSMVEEFQAINWYQERIESSQDGSLKKVLGHNRDEEKEHAAMLFEWICKHDPKEAAAVKKHD